MFVGSRKSVGSGLFRRAGGATGRDKHTMEEQYARPRPNKLADRTQSSMLSINIGVELCDSFDGLRSRLQEHQEQWEQ